MMLPFICSYRNKNEPTDIYPSLPKSFDPNPTPSRVILDVLWHNNSRAVLKGPSSSQALKTMTVQRERLKGGKTGEDSHCHFNAGWKPGCPQLDFRKVTTTDLDSVGNSVLVTAMFCKWCEMAGFKHNNRIFFVSARTNKRHHHHWATRARKHTRKRQTCR